ncbi:putative bifunctional diguanylate cyclase/phosphodiesterase [Chitinimonas sp. BJB300]|uniref:putative bifunctional diguanylate cyclase/phosphodiesterase n=1 Tax=Chitinimonas sp. BJB300 TaxID=1559339 RepID=UPI001303F662|nr:EAL domain-containing protein [Chitinimonas sp. BJB300]
MNAKPPIEPTLLLVDDLSSNLLSLKALLDDGSRRLLTANSGEAALETLLSETVALVLLDVQMPGMDGFEVLRLMRNNRRTRDIPVLLLTAHMDGDVSMLAGYEAGAIDYLTKPIRSEILLAKVASLLELQNARLQLQLINEEITQAREFYSSILDTTGEGILVVGADLEISYANPAARRLLGSQQMSDLDLPFSVYIPCESSSMSASSVSVPRPSSYFTHLAMLRTAYGSELSVQLSCAQLPGSKGSWVVAFQDVGPITRLEQELRHQAVTDPLTGLRNRKGFFQTLNNVLSRALRQSEMVGLLYLDLDDFKLVNDSLGHAVGDQLLKAFSERLSQQLRRYDGVCRLGGDEFTIVLEAMNDEAQISGVAEKIIQAQQQSYDIAGHSLNMSVSIGIATHPDCGTTAEELLQSADTAMYQAKREGRNNFRHFSPEMNSRVRVRALLLDSLRRAMIEEQFFLVYQPQVRVSDGRMTGMEALLRWQHPEAGLINPATFIPLLEESGLIVQVSRWILREACEQRRAWAGQLADDVTVSVNLSAKQFADEHLLNDIAMLLEETQLPSHCLELEVTEGAVIGDMHTSQRLIGELRKMGVRISMDDFGTGYSSLAYLKQLTLDVLKIDRLFVSNLPNDKRDQTIARVIIQLAHDLDLEVIAEGVETAEQLALLADMGCETIQGFYFSKPLPASEIPKLPAHFKTHCGLN